MKMKFPDLKASDVECKVKQVSQKGCLLLLYKDARVDMRILDETVGPMDWQRKHEFKNGILYCSVGIYDQNKDEWVWKEDVGIESNSDPKKGQASDSFKRACFNWGIGRELYSAPFIWIDAADVKIDQKNGKSTTRDKFHVSMMQVTDGNITGLAIINDRSKKCVFKMNNSFVDKDIDKSAKTPEKSSSQQKMALLTDSQMKLIYTKAKEAGVDNEGLHKGIEKYFGKQSMKDITKEQMDQLLKMFEDKIRKDKAS